MPDDPRTGLRLRRIINASGTMTVLGASSAVPEAVQAARELLPWFVEIDDLQRRASDAIAAATGAEAGCVTASSAAAITLTIAAAMTGSDLDRIARLPDPGGMKNGVVIQRGHLIDYGAPLEQAIRLAGARVVPMGESRRVELHQLENALDATIAAALYVVSHHTEQSGQIPLARFVEACHRRGVPVIVDAASEYDLRGFIAAGADIAIYSAHKFLGGLTAGIVAGRKDLVRAAYLQNSGIGRGMKVGKEGVVGTIAALGAWARRDHLSHRRAEEARVALWRRELGNLAGIRAELSPDPTNNPITRVRLHVDAKEAGITAWDLADALAGGERPIMERDDEIEHGHFELDPCNLSDAEAEEVAAGIIREVHGARATPKPASSFAEWSARRLAARLAWPDYA
jgi:L-seryl-tRNA(Ser) seleniumtransferase